MGEHALGLGRSVAQDREEVHVTEEEDHAALQTLSI
jgi:hypothetical protein